MTVSAEATVVRFFSDRVQADRAVDKLGEAGFSPGQIRVAPLQRSSDDSIECPSRTHADTGAFVGALAGVALGGVVGIGLVSGVFPALGPPFVAGTFATLLASTASSTAMAGLIGALIGWGIRKEPRNHYEDRLEQGGLVVTVQAPGLQKMALEILNLCGGAKQ